MDDPKIWVLSPPNRPRGALSLKLNNDLISHFKDCLQKKITPKFIVKDGNYVCIFTTSLPREPLILQCTNPYSRSKSPTI